MLRLTLLAASLAALAAAAPVPSELDRMDGLTLHRMLKNTTLSRMRSVKKKLRRAPAFAASRHLLASCSELDAAYLASLKSLVTSGNVCDKFFAFSQKTPASWTTSDLSSICPDCVAAIYKLIEPLAAAKCKDDDGDPYSVTAGAYHILCAMDGSAYCYHQIQAMESDDEKACKSHSECVAGKYCYLDEPGDTSGWCDDAENCCADKDSITKTCDDVPGHPGCSGAQTCTCPTGQGVSNACITAMLATDKKHGAFELSDCIHKACDAAVVTSASVRMSRPLVGLMFATVVAGFHAAF